MVGCLDLQVSKCNALRKLLNNLDSAFDTESLTRLCQAIVCLGNMYLPGQPLLGTAWSVTQCRTHCPALMPDPKKFKGKDVPAQMASLPSVRMGRVYIDMEGSLCVALALCCSGACLLQQCCADAFAPPAVQWHLQ